jgi:hypothetical protein
LQLMNRLANSFTVGRIADCGSSAAADLKSVHRGGQAEIRSPKLDNKGLGEWPGTR